jgi:hypothetical protein
LLTSSDLPLIKERRKHKRTFSAPKKLCMVSTLQTKK